ncbi:hypothetical protein PRIC2_002682 [Phytophthora ramorum]
MAECDGNADTDRLLVEGVESLDEYLNEHEIACAQLKQGFLKLTKARLRLPDHTLTEVSYHEEFEASRVVTLDSEGNWRLRDASKVKVDTTSGGDSCSSLQHRRVGKDGQDEEPVATVSSNTRLNADTLLWFSSLPPSDLRQAQKQFASGLQALLVVASAAGKVQRAVHGVTKN